MNRDTWKNLQYIIGDQREAWKERVDIMIIENPGIDEDEIKSLAVEDSLKNYNNWVDFIESKKKI